MRNHSHGTQGTFALDQEQIHQFQEIKDVLSREKNCVCDLLFSIIFSGDDTNKNIYPLTNTIIRTYLEEFTDICTKIFTTLLLTITATTKKIKFIGTCMMENNY